MYLKQANDPERGAQRLGQQDNTANRSDGMWPLIGLGRVGTAWRQH